MAKLKITSKDTDKEAKTSGTKTFSSKTNPMYPGQDSVQRIDLTKNQRMVDLLLPQDPEFQKQKNSTPAQTKPSILRDRNTGKVTGVKLPNGKTFNGNLADVNVLVNDWLSQQPSEEDTKIESDYALEQKKKAYAESQIPQDNIASQIGQLTPEQEAYINQNPEMSGNPRFGDVLKSAGESAAIAGGGTATALAGAAAVGAPFTGGLSVAGGAIAAGGVGAVAGIRSIFIEYKKTDKANYDKASYNYDSARVNIQDSITLANNALTPQERELAVKNFNQGLAQIDFSERQLKELSGDQTKYIDDIQGKLTEIADYRKNDADRLKSEMSISLEKSRLRNG